MPYTYGTAPFVVPTNDGKLIEEFLGLASSGHDHVSVAHMVAPSGWSEPPQTPEFDEVTIVLRGRKQAEIDGETVTLEPGRPLLVRAGSTVRYSNPFDEEVEYWAICIPAFTLDRVNRTE